MTRSSRSEPKGSGAAGEAAPELSQQALVDGIVMRWEEHGPASGVPVVMLHGIPTHPRLWRYVIPRVVGDRVRCLAWELVGFGGSMQQGLGRDISLRCQVDYLRSWMRHLGVQRAVLVGHDLGGGLAQSIAVQHPEVCSAIVLCDCVAYDNWPVPRVKAARKMRKLIEWLPPAVLRPAFLAAYLSLGSGSAKRRLESAELHWRHYAARFGPRAFAHQLHHLDNRDTLDIAPGLARLCVPAHVVWGEKDPLAISSGQRLAADLGASFTRIAGGKHLSPEHSPQIIADAVLSVLPDALSR